MRRRNFLKKGGVLFSSFSILGQSFSHDLPLSPFLSSKNEAENGGWDKLRRAYPQSEHIYLNTGGTGQVLNRVTKRIRLLEKELSQSPTYFLWTKYYPRLKEVKVKLADILSVSPEEISLCSNTTEALETMIFGYPFEEGDEVVLGKYDYSHMRFAFEQLVKQKKLNLKYAEFPIDSESNEEVIGAYAKLITPQTKLVHLTHITSYNGRIFPVSEISKIAHKKGAEVMVDGAHSIGLLDFNMIDLGCDYFGSSCHKWLSGPLGTGFFWMKKEHIRKIRPFFGSEAPKGIKIEKFDSRGTRRIQDLLALGDALSFYKEMGPSAKEQRLRKLGNKLKKELQGIPGLVIDTPLRDEMYISMISFHLEDESVENLGNLMRDNKVVASQPMIDNQRMIRISVNLSHRENDIEKVVELITDYQKRKLGK